ncbi:MAG: aldo/keto reductase [Nitriliruptor sp.]|uniref:aldo/keto reductase n=1 Tax=Nitriliruptor sp. TaxID=2448056 RepID=UPI00349FF75D
METRHIGSLEVSAVGLGCNNFGRRLALDGTRPVVEAALDEGVTLFDTADVYRGDRGWSEELLGAALGRHRDEVVIATKFGMELDEQRRGAAPGYVRSACEASLRRLGTDHIDLYQLHQPDPDVPIAETIGALGELVTAGWVREIGHSNLSADEVDAAAAATEGPRFVCAQDQWSLLDRDIERDGNLSAVRRHGLAVLPYFPLASGLLTGKYTSGEDHDPSWRLVDMPEDRRAERLNDERLATTRQLAAFAADRDRTLLELAVSWLAVQVPVASVIAGATHADQIRANVRAVGWQLTADDLAEIDAITGVGDQPR